MADIIKRFESKGYQLVAIKASNTLHHNSLLPAMRADLAFHHLHSQYWTSGSDVDADPPNLLQVIVPSQDIAKQHYAEHDGKPFFPGLVRFLTSGPVVGFWSQPSAAPKPICACPSIVFPAEDVA